jgi:hypothetical protein
MLDRVPGAAKWRGVGQVQVAELGDAGPVADRGRQDVDPLGDLGADLAEQLRAEQPPGLPVAGQPYLQGVAPG